MAQHVVFDFDDTITQHDTIGNIAEAALAWRKTPQGGSVDLAEDWQRILQAYLQDVAAYDRTQPPAQQRTTWPQQRDYLHGRSVVEKASLARIQQAGLFAGFAAHGRLVEAGRRDRESGRTRLRRGVGEYIAMLQARHVAVHVVSVNWSASYIRGVLAPWDITSIIANEIQPDGSIAALPESLPENGGCRSSPPPALATSLDKVEAAQHLLRNKGGQCRGYFGDSTTDLECLALYGGCVMTSDGEGSLVSTLRRLGHHVPHVGEPRGDGPGISWARDFAEMGTNALERDLV